MLDMLGHGLSIYLAFSKYQPVLILFMVHILREFKPGAGLKLGTKSILPKGFIPRSKISIRLA